MRIQFPLLLLAAALGGCTTYSDLNPVGALDYVLAKHADADGGTTEFHLDTSLAGGRAALRVVREAERERPFLGLRVDEIGPREAEQRGVAPYSGLLVRGVYEDSSAAKAGVLAGDVLLTLGGEPIVYGDQLERAVAGLAAAQVVEAKLLRGQREVTLPLTTALRREAFTDDQGVPLDEPQTATRPYAGARLFGIPRVWCERIWGEARDAVVIASVDPGSPAWVGGFRGGDVLLDVDGQPVPPVDELVRQIAVRGAGGATMRWRVQRAAADTYEGEVALGDYTRETNVWLPFVFRLRDGAFEDTWSVGPFGLLLSNRNHYVVEADNRAAPTRNVFNALFGLIHVESGPHHREVRLLWFLRFAS